MVEGAKLYVGNLDHSAERRDLEDAFSKFGHVEDVWIARKPPGYDSLLTSKCNFDCFEH